MDTQKQSSLSLGSHFEPVTLELPWPPSINHYFMEYAMPPATAMMQKQLHEHGFDGFHHWLRKNTRVMKRVGEKGHQYRADVLEYVLKNRLNKGFREPLMMRLRVNPPDRRERDLDNLYKPLLDALEKAAVFRNDSQVKGHDSLFYDETIKHGRLVVVLEELLY